MVRKCRNSDVSLREQVGVPVDVINQSRRLSRGSIFNKSTADAGGHNQIARSLGYPADPNIFVPPFSGQHQILFDHAIPPPQDANAQVISST